VAKVKASDVKKGDAVRVKSKEGMVEGEVAEVEELDRGGETKVELLVNTANGGFIRPMLDPDAEIELVD
jgi:hypothetical protein